MNDIIDNAVNADIRSVVFLHLVYETETDILEKAATVHAVRDANDFADFLLGFGDSLAEEEKDADDPDDFLDEFI